VSAEQSIRRDMIWCFRPILLQDLHLHRVGYTIGLFGNIGRIPGCASAVYEGAIVEPTGRQPRSAWSSAHGVSALQSEQREIPDAFWAGCRHGLRPPFAWTCVENIHSLSQIKPFVQIVCSSVDRMESLHPRSTDLTDGQCCQVSHLIPEPKQGGRPVKRG
jgi:hypothetical protein